MKTNEISAQIDKLLAEYDQLRRTSQFEDLSDRDEESQTYVVRLRAALDRLVPSANSYAKEAATVEGASRGHRIMIYVGILRALKADIHDGWVEGIAELLHAETFDDLIDQAEELLTKGYKGSGCRSSWRDPGVTPPSTMRKIRRANTVSVGPAEEGRDHERRSSKGQCLQYSPAEGCYILAWHS
jgi:hypothetical protein